MIICLADLGIPNIFVLSLFSREQRVTGVMVFLLTGLSVKLAPILKVLSKVYKCNV